MIEWSRDARFAVGDESVCCVCGRYAAYICDENEADVCSKQCKRKCLKSASQQRVSVHGAHTVVAKQYEPYSRDDDDDDDDDDSIVESIKCMLCGNVGHLPNHCASTS